MKRGYSEPKVNIRLLSAEDIMVLSDVITDGEDFFDPDAE